MINIIIRHELRLMIFNRRTWYCVAAIYSLLATIFNWLLQKYLLNQTTIEAANFGLTEEVIHPFYAWYSLLILLSLPMLAAQSICSEKIHRTMQNYYCAPITGQQIIIGKFLAILIAIIILSALLSIIPLSILHTGKLDWGQLCASICGVQLMLCAALALSFAIASYMRNIIRTNLFILLAIVFFVLLEWAAQYTGSYAIFLQNFGLLAPLKNFLAGIINLQSLAYYLLLTISFIWLASKRILRGDLDG